jgi:radical SAM superfamily enzyme YgiQ (UPF0313 family)
MPATEEATLAADSWKTAPAEAPPAGIRGLHVYIIKPSKYDDDGYVIRYFRGVLPSNTLSALYSLTQEVKKSKVLGEDLQIETTLLDETVQKVDVRAIVKHARRRPDTRTVIALAGVQSNQFPRAADLARRFRSADLPVMIGGFHVSGLLALADRIPDDIQALMDQGVTIVKGEVEETWGSLLQDALHGRLNPLYDFLNDKPDLYAKPIPRVHRSYMKRFAFSGFGTIDAGRGCPYDCSFCTIINVQGKKMRHRSADLIEERIREDYAKNGIRFYFFTDDNFARNKSWEAIMDVLVRLRREGMDLEFMMQVDVQSYKIPGFIAKAKEAGCSNVFIGMESINPKNLEAAGKTQNDADDFKNLIAAWHNAGIITHVGYILGFPHDSPESIREDIRRLKEEIKVDMASFFVLTPLPGSMDHLSMLRRGDEIDPDYNRYDSFHETIRHPNFKPGELDRAYREVWETFYGRENMKAVLSRSNRETYWDIFKNYVWYKSALIEGEHPMISGFFRLKDRTERRPGYAVEGRLTHARRRVRETARLFRAWWGLLLEMEEVWLQTHERSRERIEYVKDLQHRVADLLIQMKGLDRREMKQRLIDALHQFKGMDALEFRHHLDGIIRYLREFDAKQALSHVVDQIRSIQQQIEESEKVRDCATSAVAMRDRAVRRVRSAWDRVNLFSVRRVKTREPLHRFWLYTKEQVRKGRLYRINPILVAVNFVRDARLLVAFFYGLAVARTRYTNLSS